MARNKNNVNQEPKETPIEELIVEEEKDIITEETPIEEPIEIDLKIKIAFTDKYTGVDYVVGKVYAFETVRANELLADSRGLVEKISLGEVSLDE